ncbi:hypothetical protein [Chitinophaga skermanii]|uniref:hypothetical protein n=1 Tax=Chitinophaga skermanii TaxID=331697 RepID=UPI0011E596EF|nr:hypothetical protein [Chitinophaga skermanii]
MPESAAFNRFMPLYAGLCRFMPESAGFCRNVPENAGFCRVTLLPLMTFCKVFIDNVLANPWFYKVHVGEMSTKGLLKPYKHWGVVGEMSVKSR